jgi:hypothetical protein
MKNLLYLAVAIIALSSCKKTNKTPTVATATTTYPMGINYVTSTYSNFDLHYSLNGGEDDFINNNSQIELTYVPGDSIHFELITDAPLDYKSETIPCYIKNESTDGCQYIFKTSETEIQVIMYPDGKKYGYVGYYAAGVGNGQQYGMALKLAD